MDNKKTLEQKCHACQTNIYTQEIMICENCPIKWQLDEYADIEEEEKQAYKIYI